MSSRGAVDGDKTACIANLARLRITQQTERDVLRQMREVIRLRNAMSPRGQWLDNRRAETYSCIEPAEVHNAI
jgi:Asp-tRNA(Asn)/Glu-tRNA(Gln) amidotransferase C subunit